MSKEQWFKYTGTGEIGDSIPGVGVIGKAPLKARDEAHLKRIQESGVYESTAAPKAEPEQTVTFSPDAPPVQSAPAADAETPDKADKGGKK